MASVFLAAFGAKACVADLFFHVILPPYEDALSELPRKMYSGKRSGKSKGFFFCYELPTKLANGEWSNGNGLYRWYFLDSDTGTICEKTYDIWRLIQCDENEPRVVTATEEHFAQARKKAEDYIKRSYMRSVQAPLGVKPRLVSIDFPRVPYPSGKEIFLQLAAKGAELRRLHTMQETVSNDLGIAFEGAGSAEITKVEYTNGKVRINRTQFFSGIREELWEFPFGGYRSLQKWFKDRKNHILSETEIAHVIKVFNILDRTSTIMSEIDELYAQHGITFRCD